MKVSFDFLCKENATCVYCGRRIESMVTGVWNSKDRCCGTLTASSSSSSADTAFYIYDCDTWRGLWLWHKHGLMELSERGMYWEVDPILIIWRPKVTQENAKIIHREVKSNVNLEVLEVWFTQRKIKNKKYFTGSIKRRNFLKHAFSIV